MAMPPGTLTTRAIWMMVASQSVSLRESRYDASILNPFHGGPGMTFCLPDTPIISHLCDIIKSFPVVFQRFFVGFSGAGMPYTARILGPSGVVLRRMSRRESSGSMSLPSLSSRTLQVLVPSWWTPV